MTQSDLFDPKGLMKDAFVIDGITAPECRSIFLDWALGLPADRAAAREAEVLLVHYQVLYPQGHPMLDTLQAATVQPARARRRGGRKARVSNDGGQ